MGGLGGFGSMLLLVSYFTLLAQSHISSFERSGLLDLRSSLGLRSKDWPIKSDPCSSWRGIKCRNGRVTEINISGFRRTRAGRLNPSFSVDALANFTLLESFNASYFYLPGSIPEWFGSRLGSLKALDLRSSSVTGSIPSSLGNLTMLNELYLSGNDISGSVPYTLGELVQLKVLDLSSNLLTGSVPSDLALLGNLSRLDLSSNFLSGSFPHGLGGISRLQVLNLSDNGFAGSIPVELGNLSRLVDLDLSKNSLSGTLPVGLSGLRNLQQMVIGSSGLEGRLPDGLFTNLSELQVVVLSGNKFDGALPSALWSLPKLRVVDVSSNNFAGDLSSFSSNRSGSGAAFNLSNNAFYGTLTSLGNFSVVDVSGNYFQGKVPDGSPSNIMLDRNCLQGVPDQRTLDDCRLFYVERGLTFDNFGSPAPNQAPLAEHDSNGSKRWIYILVGLLGGIGFVVILVFVILFFIRKCDRTFAKQRGRANVGPVPEGDSTSTTKDPVLMSGLGDSFTYEQLFHITGEFNEKNLIKHGHSGDIFQGFLEGGSPIVVKRIHARSSRKDSYMMEIELLSKYSHARLVPLLGHCMKNEHEKFLVYKSMPNRDLATSLFRESNSADSDLQSLDWITRLKIATGVAEGLSYLHHECNPPLVHRDVQASSILLDDKFEVRLGSLSEIHAQEGGDAHCSVFTRFLRKQQSSEPGPSGSSSANCAYDVYCFGKVLLELVTGKLGISSSEDASIKEWLEHILAYIDMYDKELVTKILDPSLVLDEDLLEEVWAMAIVARSCLNPKPSKRPPMKYVLKALENPLKIVREDSHSSGRLRTTSSRRSWSTAFFGSWRHSSSDNATVVGQLNREGLGSSKQPVRVGSHGSGGIDLTYYKRPSNEIFPEPLEMQDEDIGHS